MSTNYAGKNTLLAGAIGNVLEWYDFALYGYFAPVFAALFFPSDSPSVSLIAAFSVLPWDSSRGPSEPCCSAIGAIRWGDAGLWLGRSS